MTVKGKFVKW